MAFAKHLWECYELKCLHFIDNQFAPVKKRSWYNKHANERVDIVCPYEWKRVGHLLESLKETQEKKVAQDSEAKSESTNPQPQESMGMKKITQKQKNLKEERENKFIQPNPAQVIQGELKNCYLSIISSKLSEPKSEFDHTYHR